MNPFKTKFYIFSLLILFGYQSSFAQQSWKEITTIKELYKAYPDLVKGVFDHIDLEHKGLEKVKLAASEEDWVLAANELLAYYRISENAKENFTQGFIRNGSSY